MSKSGTKAARSKGNRDCGKLKRVLVTGAQGLLGSTLVPHLQACGHEVFRHGRKGDIDVGADLIDVGQVNAALDQVAPEVVINLAALTDVDECERSPKLAYLSNVLIVENLVKWIQNNGNTCHLVQLSTDQVYDGLGPHMESDITLTNYYGFSKYAGELAAATVPSTILRTNFFRSKLLSKQDKPERLAGAGTNQRRYDNRF